MSVSETMAVTLLIAGGLSVYLVLHAALDFYRLSVLRRED